VLKAAPEVCDSARANRAFLQRAVRYLVGEAGIGQIIDVGTGIPAAGNVHEVAAQVAAGTRVAFVDNDRYKSGCAYASKGWPARVSRH
jgi:S-adenosyl methyltransferase